jgi:aminoglycoside phosphotransferase (APT) family kinase protein
VTDGNLSRDAADRASSRAEPDVVLREFVVDQRLAAADDVLRWTPLTGGVSSDIWRVDLPRRSVCIKRALPKLNVAQTWTAPIERNAYEWAWLEFASRHCPGNVPTPIAADAARAVFAMAYLDAKDHPVWKGALLDGVADPRIASQVAAILARLHAASARDPAVAQRFATDAIFHAIRLEPYLLATAVRHPDLAERLRGLAQRTAENRIALVHGDVSQKNILLGPRGPVFLDAECAWYGDPAFDAAFCLNHFLLKCVARPQFADDYVACYAAFADAYLAGVTWESREGVEARIASLVPALMLARVDGKSPVEYITHDADRNRIRSLAGPLIAAPPTSVLRIAGAWRQWYPTSAVTLPRNT